jgi:N-acetylmuramoyl-L-alanine amidase
MLRDPESLKAALAAGEGLLRGKVICLDAGHGGHDPGAPGVGGVWEKEMNLQMALAAARALEAVGATVVLTRSADTYRSLNERYDLANARGVDLFISIHCNAMPRFDMASGTQTYYCHEGSLALARVLHPQIVAAMGGLDRGIHCRRFAVVRHTEMPAVLLEIGYINHSEDAQKLADPEYQLSIGEAVRAGVIRYYGR